MAQNNNYCLILAGGQGRRLWPCSRARHPKQFIDFFGVGRTQLQQTYDRMVQVVPADHIFINTSILYLDLVMEQLPNVPRSHIMAEPIHRNTAPSMAWATYRLANINPRGNLIAVPSDQTVMNEAAFHKNVAEAFDFVQRHNAFLTMGVVPTRPEPGYGYIQMNSKQGDNIYHVKSFTEKPNREFATMFMESGEFLWNTGMFLANIDCLLSTFARLLPSVLRALYEANRNATAEEEDAYMMEHFPVYPNMSMESGVLEKVEDVCVMKCDFGWADLGTWHGIYEAMPKMDDDNVVIDSEVIIENSHQNVVKLSKGKVGVICGLDGFIVAEKDNVLLICKKEDSSSLVRKFVNEVQMKKGDEFV